MPRKIKVENLAEMPESEGRTAVVEEIKSEEQQVAEEPKDEPKVEEATVAKVEEAPKPKAKARGRSKKVDDKSALADSLTQIVSSAVSDCLPPCGLVDDSDANKVSVMSEANIAEKPKKVRAKKDANNVSVMSSANVKEVEPVPMKEEQPDANKVSVMSEANSETNVAEAVKEEKPKKDEKVSCPDCGRKVSAKTLKYTHMNNCKAFKAEQQVHSAVVYQEETVEDKMQRRRAQRLQQKEERIQSLIADAF